MLFELTGVPPAEFQIQITDGAELMLALPWYCPVAGSIANNPNTGPFGSTCVAPRKAWY